MHSNNLTVRQGYFAARKLYQNLNETEIKLIICDINRLEYNLLSNYYEQLILDVDRFYAYLNRVNEGEPLQYVLGYTYFRDMKFMVNKDVLIPRPETEQIIDLVSNAIKDNNNQVVADICTGSGVIAICLSKLSNHLVYASDISSKAVIVAERNASMHHADVRFLVGNALEPLISANIKIDLLVANPPYIYHDDEIGDNVINHEPSLALFKPLDDVYISIFNNIKRVMRTNKITIIFEINERDGLLIKKQAELILGDSTSAIVIKDIYGKDRFVQIEYENIEIKTNTN